VKKAMWSCILLLSTTACRQSDLPSKSYGETYDARAQAVGSQDEDAITPKTDLDSDKEEITIPQNVSGQYLIGCHPQGDLAALTGSPAHVDFQCRIEKPEGDIVAAKGEWSGLLRNQTDGERLVIMDPTQGVFQLSLAQTNNFSPSLERMVITFRGVIETTELTVVGMNFSSLNQEIQSIKQGLPVAYEFTVKIVSGTLMGQAYSGSFTYDPKRLKGIGQETIPAQSLQFSYLPANQQVFDSPGNLLFTNGALSSLMVTGGPSNQRFGINAGFDRNQFGRASEAFVRNGDQYFGYLNAATFVDGAGTISYVRK